MFENRTQEALDIATAIERKLIALGIQQDDQIAMTELAREALNPVRVNEARVNGEAGDRSAKTRFEIFGLAVLMFDVMKESAIEDHFKVSGNAYWKAFARALYAMQDPIV